MKTRVARAAYMAKHDASSPKRKLLETARLERILAVRDRVVGEAGELEG